MYAASWNVLRDDPDLRMNNANVKDLVHVLCFDAFELLKDLVFLGEFVEPQIPVRGVSLIVCSIHVQYFERHRLLSFKILTEKVDQQLSSSGNAFAIRRRLIRMTGSYSEDAARIGRSACRRNLRHVYSPITTFTYILQPFVRRHRLASSL
jgi:hypothetical protein